METEEYTIAEYLNEIGIVLRRPRRVLLGRNAVKIAKRINDDADKKWKKECVARPKGARLWPITILRELLPENVIYQMKGLNK